MIPHKLVLLRHGESEWNLQNRFTGWTDVDLTEKGIYESKFSGNLLKESELGFDIIFTSVLKRAILTMDLCLKQIGIDQIPIEYNWRLNERHYGKLQGLNKAETAQKYGDDQVLIWRRSYDTRPPPLDLNDKRHPRFDDRYRDLTSDQLPASECLKDTVERFLPLWHNNIAPSIQSGKRLLIVAHGNSLRALIKYLDHISDKDIISLNIPTGTPLVYELDEKLNSIRHYYLGNQDAIDKKVASVSDQGKSSKKI